MVIFHSPPPGSSFEWAESKHAGVVSELTLLTPIKPGLIPGERRTYEERLRDHLASLQRREEAGIPSFVRPIFAIHFGRWFILRPEQYLQYSNVGGVQYYEDAEGGAQAPFSLQHTPVPMDDYREVGGAPADESDAGKDDPRFMSWLLFVVEFDGDLKSYVRHVVETIQEDVDRIWGNCYGYPGAKDFEKFWLYARRHQINTDAFYGAYSTLSVARIHQLRVFKDKFDAFITRTRNPDGTSRDDIGPLLDEFLRSNLQYTSEFPSHGGIYDETQGDRVRGRSK